MAYILGIDQSTQGTKALLFDETGKALLRVDKPHRQIINDQGWVEHDPEEIYANTLALAAELLQKTGVPETEIAAVGISNQRETALAWDRITGKPVYNAIVWQCARGKAICDRLAARGLAPLVKERTGLQLSPYFSAAKLAWILENVPEAKAKQEAGRLCMGTMDSWLVYKLTGGRVFKTDASNASRTQLFNIEKLAWDEDLSRLFGIKTSSLAQVSDSNGSYGETDFGGLFKHPVPIRAVFGDSHAALFGQGCHQPGQIKATYGTGSSVMMNIGPKPVWSQKGLVTSLAWQLDGRASYVLEGNINYTGAAVSWLKHDLELVASAGETEALARAANPADKSYFVPAFTGLGAPYWDNEARGLFTGISRLTGRKEMVRAVLDSVAYQIQDITSLMQEESGQKIQVLRVDGGPTRNKYLMQFQTDVTGIPVEVPEVEELSAMGAAYGAGLAVGVYNPEVFNRIRRERYQSSMTPEKRQELLAGWRQAVRRTLAKV